jgi:hypothetical protein
MSADEDVVAAAGTAPDGDSWTHGNYYLYGLVTSRIRTVRTEGGERGAHTDVATSALPGATANDGSALRTFVLVRPPVDDVTALVGLDRHGRVAQEIRFPRGRRG